MKRNLRYLFTAVLAALLLGGCKDPSRNLTLYVNTDLNSAPTSLQFLNANYKGPNQPGYFPVTIDGPDAILVRTSDGKNNFMAQRGMLNLYLPAGVHPTPQNPVRFTVHVGANSGFMPYSKTIVLTSDSATTQRVFLTDRFALPAGVGYSEQRFTLNRDGATTVSQTIPVLAVDAFGKKINASLTIPAGTVLLDSTGGSVGAGAATVHIGLYSNDPTGSLLAFPGGLDALDAVDPIGRPFANGVHFNTAGLLHITMDVNGVEVKRFSKPLEAQIGLRERQINFFKGGLTVAGDTIPTWSQEESSGKWRQEGSAPVFIATDGNLAASFKITHLSNWNLDWWWGQNSPVGTCNNPLRIVVNTEELKFSGGHYDITLETESGGYLAAEHYVSIYDGYTTYMPYVPSITKARLIVYDMSPSNYRNAVVRSDLFDPCSAGTVTVKVPGTKATGMVDVNLDVTGTCTDQQVTADLSGWFYVYAANGNYQDAASVYVKNGKAHFYLKDKQQYNVFSIYGDQLLYTSFTLDGSSGTIPGNGSISGKVDYNAVNQTYTITGNVSYSCR